MRQAEELVEGSLCLVDSHSQAAGEIANRSFGVGKVGGLDRQVEVDFEAVADAGCDFVEGQGEGARQPSHLESGNRMKVPCCRLPEDMAFADA